MGAHDRCRSKLKQSRYRLKKYLTSVQSSGLFTVYRSGPEHFTLQGPEYFQGEDACCAWKAKALLITGWISDKKPEQRFEWLYDGLPGNWWSNISKYSIAPTTRGDYHLENHRNHLILCGETVEALKSFAIRCHYLEQIDSPGRSISERALGARK